MAFKSLDVDNCWVCGLVQYEITPACTECAYAMCRLCYNHLYEAPTLEEVLACDGDEALTAVLSRTRAPALHPIQ